MKAQRKGDFLVLQIVNDRDGIKAAALNVSTINAIESTDDKRGAIIYYNKRKLIAAHSFDTVLNLL